MIKFLKRAAVVLVCAVTFSQTPMHVYAAAFRQRYISEVTTVCGLNETEAEAQLKEGGYKMLATNVNATLNTPVYIGYRTTYNIDEAIHGLSFMNMTGKYSFSDYEQLIESNRELVDQKIDSLSAAIELYRTNYDDGQEAAVRVYDLLNRVIEDNSDQGMGDFLMNCSLESGNRAELVDAIMKGNNQLIVSIIQLLDMAASTESTSWLTRLANTTYDTMLDEYAQAYPSVSKAQKALSQDYDGGALQVYDQWGELYGTLQAVENEIPKDEENGYDIEAMGEVDTSELPEPANEEEKEAQQARIETASAIGEAEAGKAAAVYEMLKQYSYGEGTMLDFFNRPKDEVALTELYPLVRALGKARIGTMAETGLINMIVNAMKPDDWDDSMVDSFNTVMDEMEEVSLYYGTDLRKFESGIALTSAASQIERSTGKSWFYSSMDGFFDPGKQGADRWGSVILMGLGAVLLLGTSIAGVVAHKFLSLYGTKSTKEVIKSSKTKAMYIYLDEYDLFGHNAKLTPWGIISQRWYFSGSQTGIGRYVLYGSVIFIAMTFIASVAVTIMDIYQGILAAVRPDTYEYDKIPMLICDGYHGEDFQDYVLYDLAPCLNKPAQFADMNGYDEEKNPNGWLCLYYTKDVTAGAPVTEISIRTGSDKAGIKEEGIGMFGEANALNVTDKIYTNKEDTTGGTYLFLKRAESAQAVGSAMSTGTLAVIGGGCFLLGGILGFALRRRKEIAAA